MNANDFLALALDSLGQDTLSPYTSQDTAIKIATAKSHAEEREYGVFMREAGRWYSIGIAVAGVYTPKAQREEVSGL